MLTVETITGAARSSRTPDEQAAQIARLRELVGINRLITGPLDPDRVLPLVVEKSAQLIEADACVLLLADAAGRATVVAGLGVDASATAGFETALDEHLDVALRRLLASGAGDELMAVPVVAQGVVDGVLAAHWRAPRGPHPDDEFLLSAMADQAAIALANAVSYQSLYRSEREARETAEQAVLSRDQFLAMVSHDLRNPLGTILMSAMLLQRTLPATGDPSLRLQADRIQRSVDQMIRLVDDLLDVATMEAGTFAVERSPHDAVGLAREVVDPFVASAKARSIDLRVALPEGALPIACDRQRVQQVLGNLLGNAIKFTPEDGSVVLRVEPKAGEAVFSVADTGPGIPDSQLPRIFDRFWQADHQHGTGSGLGLFIARSLVEAHGGRIWAESRMGVGSVFSFAVALLPDGA